MKNGLENCLKGQHIFTKYPELVNGKDVGPKGIFPFAEGGYSDFSIVAETMRAYPTACFTGATFLMPIQAPKEQIDYLHHVFDLPKPEIVLFDNSNPDAYIEILESLSPGTVHILHPYENLNESACAVSPQLIHELNSKTNLGKLTPYTATRKVLSLEEISQGEDPILQEPFVVKKIAGSSGDGLKVVENPKYVNGIASFLNPGEIAVVEKYIKHVANHSIQFFVDKSGSIQLIGSGLQQTTDEGEYEGCIAFFDKRPSEALLEVATSTCESIAKSGYHGFVGLDILEDEKGNYFVIDPNVRWTAATSMYLLGQQLVDKLGPCTYISSVNVQGKTPQAAIDKITQSGGLLLSMSHPDVDKYTCFAIVGAADEQAVMAAWKGFEQKVQQ